MIQDSSGQHSAPLPTRRLYYSVALAIVVLAAVIRVLGSLNDLWLDEIWSVNFARSISSPVEVFTGIHHDNNHYLNTVWLHVQRQQGNPAALRLLSIVAGVGAVIVAGLIGRRRDDVCSVLAMLVVGFSYVMILYSSEARGYSAAVFFSFLSYYLMDRFLEKQKWQTALMFSITAALGLLSHLIFLNVLFASLVWSVYRLKKCHTPFKPAAIALVSCYALPIAFLAALYYVDIRWQEVGGGPVVGMLIAYRDSLACALGTPMADSIRPLSCIIAALVFAGGILVLWREQSSSPVFFTGVILVVPILLAVVRDATGTYFRYFLMGIAFILILFSYVLASLYHRGLPGKVACLFLLAAYLAANGWNTMSLLKNGRGHYTEAVHLMAENSTNSVVTVVGDYNFRISTVIEFNAGQVADGKSVEYLPRSAWPKGGPEWIICQTALALSPLRRHVAADQYELVRTYPTAPLTGFNWFIYHHRAD